MAKKDLKILNIIFRVVVLCAFIMGIRTIISYYIIMNTYGKMENDLFISYALSMVEYYAIFLILIIASFILSIISRRYVSGRNFMLRSSAIVGALVIGVTSVPAMLQIGYVAAAKASADPELNFIGHVIDLGDVYSSSLSEFLIANPYLFYTYIVSVVIFCILSVTSIISLVKGDRNAHVGNHFDRHC